MAEKEKMVRVTFSFPKELKDKLDKRPDVNWPEVIKAGLRKRLDVLLKLRARGEL
ncbi:MAG: hypothetical protein U9Q69_05325 [Nanoarchaeota archaeon]|nr:hypothetical protein [Nanoarchaeota archaeon]